MKTTKQPKWRHVPIEFLGSGNNFPKEKDMPYHDGRIEDCKICTPQPTGQSWERNFDEKFTIQHIEYGKVLRMSQVSEVKDWIASLIKAEREAAVREFADDLKKKLKLAPAPNITDDGTQIYPNKYVAAPVTANDIDEILYKKS